GGGRRNATAEAAAMIPSPIETVPSLGTEAKLIDTMRAPTRTAEMMPPRLSTGSLVSLTWLGTSTTAIRRASTASGRVTRNTDPHQYFSSRPPATRGPSADSPPPIADHKAIAFVRAGPAHSAVMSASVVGYAMPAEMPPTMRAKMRKVSDGA